MAERYRPPTLARQGMVASPHYLASAAGLRTLHDGGTAVDAAIAINATLGVVYPHMTGIGGDAFWLIYDARSSRLHALNGSGRAAAVATRDWFRSRGHTAIPTRGPLAAVTVPGAVDSWCRAHDSFGRLPLRDVLAPAIGYAHDGFPVCAGLARCSSEVAQVLDGYAHTRARFLPAGRPLRTGETLRLPDLASTMEAVADKGRDGFYDGLVADTLVTALREDGGLLDLADLAAHRSDWVEPISTTYRGHSCYQHPPNSQGFSHLMILNILEGFDLRRIGENSADYLHVVAEATKAAFSDRDRFLTDPAFSDVPLDRLLSKEYAAELRATIDLGHAATPPLPADAAGDTTCAVAVDAEGNAVSVIQSLYHEFGSAYVAGDSGVLLQNRGSFCSLDDAHVNRLEPGKRTFHTLMPGMMFDGDRPALVYGAMGGEGQPQTQTALVTRIVDFGHDVQAAIDLPRWVYGRTWGAATNDFQLEGRFPAEIVATLRARGHSIRILDDWDETMGHAEAVAVDAGGLLSGGADPRGEGTAIGW